MLPVLGTHFVQFQTFLILHLFSKYRTNSYPVAWAEKRDGRWEAWPHSGNPLPIHLQGVRTMKSRQNVSTSTAFLRALLEFLLLSQQTQAGAPCDKKLTATQTIQKDFFFRGAANTHWAQFSWKRSRSEWTPKQLLLWSSGNHNCVWSWLLSALFLRVQNFWVFVYQTTNLGSFHGTYSCPYTSGPHQIIFLRPETLSFFGVPFWTPNLHR